MSEPSEYDRLFYPFLFAGSERSADDVLAQVRDSTLAKCAEVIALRRAALARQRETIVAAAQAMAARFAQGATLLAFGNGGSATDAQDLVADLGNPPYPNARPLPAIALPNDVAVITAVGNDVGFDNVFARQVIAFGRPGDIAVGISTSGNSANILAGLAQARRQGLLTVALTGYDGGHVAKPGVVDYCLIAASDHVPRIQEVQATTYHAMLDVIWALLAP